MCHSTPFGCDEMQLSGEVFLFTLPAEGFGALHLQVWDRRDGSLVIDKTFVLERRYDEQLELLRDW